MILEGVPSSPVEGKIYPNALSAEYFQAIFENTIFNNLGYDDNPREAFGIVEMTMGLGGNETVITTANSRTIDFDDDGDGGLGAEHVEIDLSESLDSLHPIEKQLDLQGS